jgi:hypothetical protein
MRLMNAVFWDVAPSRYCVNRRFGGTSVYTKSTRRHISEDDTLHSHRRENLKSYTNEIGCRIQSSLEGHSRRKEHCTPLQYRNAGNSEVCCAKALKPVCDINISFYPHASEQVAY